MRLVHKALAAGALPPSPAAFPDFLGPAKGSTSLLVSKGQGIQKQGKTFITTKMPYLSLQGGRTGRGRATLLYQGPAQVSPPNTPNSTLTTTARHCPPDIRPGTERGRDWFQ